MKRFQRRVHTKDGFTIVELLIVVVIIAILATITVLSYNGITQKAQSVRYAAAIDSVKKQLLTAATMQDMGGIFNTYGTPGLVYCWGDISDYPQTAGFEAGACAVFSNQTNAITVNQPLHGQLKNNNILSPSVIKDLQTVTSTGIGKYRGLRYTFMNYQDGTRLYLSWNTTQKVGCGGGASYSIAEDPNLDEARIFYSQLLSILEGAKSGSISYNDANIQIESIALEAPDPALSPSNVDSYINDVHTAQAFAHDSSWSCSAEVFIPRY